MDIRKVEFREIKDKGIVIAQIHGVTCDAMEKINQNFISTVTSKLYVGNYWDKAKEYEMPYSLKAVARCAPEDTYDYEMGKKIALKKLVEKYNRCVDKRIARFLINMNKVCENLDKYFENRTF